MNRRSILSLLEGAATMPLVGAKTAATTLDWPQLIIQAGNAPNMRLKNPESEDELLVL